MTVAQEAIKKYLRTQFGPYVSFIPEGVDRVTVVAVVDGNFIRKTFTTNLFMDIMDAQTKKIVAVSDLPHDLLHLSINSVPGSWKGSALCFG